MSNDELTRVGAAAGPKYSLSNTRISKSDLKASQVKNKIISPFPLNDGKSYRMARFG